MKSAAVLASHVKNEESEESKEGQKLRQLILVTK